MSILKVLKFASFAAALLVAACESTSLDRVVSTKEGAIKPAVPSAEVETELLPRLPSEVAALPKGGIVQLRSRRSADLGFGGVSHHELKGRDDAPKVVIDKKANYTGVRVFFGTNRAVQTNGSAVIVSTTRGGELVYGVASVSIPASHRMGNIERPSIFRLEFNPDPSRHVVLRDVERLPVEKWSQLISEQGRTSNGRAIIFVHGYATDFENAAMRAAQMKYDLDFGGPVAFFSWPSKGREVSYIGDTATATASRSSFNEFASRFASISGVKEVIVVAHSMGSQLVAGAFERTEQLSNDTKTKVKEIVFAAPDLDREMFMKDVLPAMRRNGHKITVYVSDKDAALKASTVVNEAPRLGSASPEPAIAEGVETIDATNVDSSFVGHSYYGDNRSIIGDLFYLVKQRLPASKRSGLRSVNGMRGIYWRFAS